jgi:hypothetical protein
VVNIAAEFSALKYPSPFAAGRRRHRPRRTTARLQVAIMDGEGQLLAIHVCDQVWHADLRLEI